MSEPNTKVIIATYPNVEIAQLVAKNLVEADFERSDIGVAARDTPDTAAGNGLLALSLNRSEMDAATEIIQAHQPIVVDTRDIQWRKEADWLVGIPDASKFSAVPLNE